MGLFSRKNSDQSGAQDKRRARADRRRKRTDAPGESAPEKKSRTRRERPAKKERVKKERPPKKLKGKKDKKEKGAKKDKKQKQPFKKKGNEFLVIELGNYSTKFALGQSSPKGLRVDRLFSRKMPPNLYNQGEMPDIPAIESFIKETMQANRVKQKDVIMTFESLDIIKREMTIPTSLNYTEAINTIGYEISQYLPIDIQSYILQYKEIRRFQEENVEKAEILVYAVPKELAKRYYDISKNIGLNPCILDVSSNCVEKLFQKHRINDSTIEGKTVALIDIGNSGMVVTILKDGRYEFNRIVKNSTSLKNSVMSITNANENMIDQLLDKYSQQVIFDPEIVPQDKMFQDAVVKTLDGWISNISKLFQYYNSRRQGNKVDKMYIYGGGVNLAAMNEYVSRRMGIPAELIQRIDGLEISPKSRERNVQRYLNVISALLRR